MVPLVVMIGAGIGAVWWLFDPHRGVQSTWDQAPGGALRFRIRFGSPLAALLWLGRRGNCGLAVGRVVHIRERHVSAALLAHELGHLIRMRGDSWRYVLRYVLVPSFRKAEEEACWEFAREHQGDRLIATLAGREG